MTLLQEIWSDVREFYRPILPWSLAGFALMFASIPARYVHPLFSDALAYCGVGAIGIMLIMYLRQVWRMQVKRDGVKVNAIVWALTILAVSAYELWRYER